MSDVAIWQPLPFPIEVHEARIERLREDCRRARLDGVLLFAQESLYYLFGYDQIGYWVFQSIYLPVDGAPFALCRAPDAFAIAQTPFIDDVRVWSDDQEEGPAAAVAAALHGLGARRVGIELRSHSLLPIHYAALVETSPGIELVDASMFVARRRAVKDRHEVERFIAATRHLAASYTALEGELVAGARECDLQAAALDAMYRDGASPTAIHPPIASGPRTMSQTHGSATTRRILVGEPVVAEIGASDARYHAVAARSYVFGEPEAGLDAMHEAASAALERGLARLGPGEPLSEAAIAVHRELSARGLRRDGRHMGYGTGIGYPPTWLDEVRVKASDPTPAEPGMTLFCFVGLSDPERQQCVYVGEPILISDAGCERPFPYDPALWRR